MDDLNQIEALYSECILNLNEREIYQWDNRYPNKDTFINSINNRCQYVFEDDAVLIGAVILNESQSEEWNLVPWNYNDGKILIIHALAINPLIQGKGYGQKVLEYCEAHAIENGYNTIRLDAFSENPSAIKLYVKNSYLRVGEVEFSSKPLGHEQYYCYEKRLKM